MANQFKSFDCFGVEVSKGREVQLTRYFNGMKEASEYFMLKKSKGFTCRLITANKWGSEIDDIT